MNRDDAVAVVTKAICAVAPDVELDDLTPTADLQADLDLDSMDLLNVVIAVHEATGIEIPERDYSELTTVGGFADYLAARA